MAIFAFFGELGVALSVRPFTPSFLRPPNIGDPCALGLSITNLQSPSTWPTGMSGLRP